MKILAIDEIDKGEEREVQKCWKKFGKARKISKNNVQRQRRPHGAVKLKDPESHRCRNVFAWAIRELPERILQRKNEKMLNCNSRPGEADFAWPKIGGAYWNGFARASRESPRRN